MTSNKKVVQKLITYKQPPTEEELKDLFKQTLKSTAEKNVILLTVHQNPPLAERKKRYDHASYS